MLKCEIRMTHNNDRPYSCATTADNKIVVGVSHVLHRGLCACNAEAHLIVRCWSLATYFSSCVPFFFILKNGFLNRICFKKRITMLRMRAQGYASLTSRPNMSQRTSIYSKCTSITMVLFDLIALRGHSEASGFWTLHTKFVSSVLRLRQNITCNQNFATYLTRHSLVRGTKK